MTLNKAEIDRLCQTFHNRAKTYMREAMEATNARDVVMLTAFASTLEWAVREVRLTAQLAALAKNDVDQVTKEPLLTEAAHDDEGSQP
jgi:hypothetical protein